jgi:cytochrome c
MKYTLIVIAATGVLAMNVACADAQRGGKLFVECAACHATEPGAGSVGPDLHGVIGRRAGTLDNFRYSPAIRKSGITWSRQTLDAYIADPQKAVPANRMPYGGMPNASDRADLLDYLETSFK